MNREQQLLLDLARRNRNYSMLEMLNKGTCPNCYVETTHRMVDGWRCYRCERVYYANYDTQNLGSKSNSYKDND